MFFGGSFLEYGRLPFPVEGELLHSIGIFMTETASGICVMAALINILEAVLERTRFDD